MTGTRSRSLFGPIVNRGLFSDHYLLRHVPELSEWSANLSRPLKSLQDLLASTIGVLPTRNEAQTEEEFIKPALSCLGWSFEPQVAFRSRNRLELPDYALFTTEEAKREAQSSVAARGAPCSREYLRRVAALGEAKYWDRPLEAKAADPVRDRTRDRQLSPHFQIIDYLDDADIRWGILTNGRLWRLYFSGGDASAIEYYEVDLQAVLEEGDGDRFKRFFLFFCSSAFENGMDGLCFLDRVREASQLLARGVEDRLKDRVFESVVPAIGAGFLRHLRERRGLTVNASDTDTLDDMYGATLLLLYRLLFLLYAEGRDLVAVGDSAGYRARSFDRLKKDIFTTLQASVPIGTSSTDWWRRLVNTFELVDRGDPALNVPCYNGGLFHPSGLGDPDLERSAHFLHDNAIADKDLASAVMLLTRDVDVATDYSEPAFIDFQDLGVSQLGSVYEGLLEFRYMIAEVPLSRATEDGRPVWGPAGSAATADLQPGDLFLTNDRAERKASGSYYTPDHLVSYIVQSTLGPHIDCAERRCELAKVAFTGRLDGSCAEEVLDAILEESPQQDEDGIRDAWKAARTTEARRKLLLERFPDKWLRDERDPPSCVLDFSVLDPAAGSAHFLVGSLDYVTKRLVVMLNKYPESPVFSRIETDRERIIESLRSQGILANESWFSDENLLRRTVMKRCLYGVDLNPLAVELAKLSLWLHALTSGAPLSFLDHHIKCGNSLVGMKLWDLQTRAGSLFRLPLEPLEDAVECMLRVRDLPDASHADVQMSRAAYEEADHLVEVYRALLHCLAAEDLGVKDAARVVDFSHGIDLHDFESSIHGLPKRDQMLLARSRHLARRLRLFHWEVEFPEVFFELRDGHVAAKEDGGFTVVVGNPPWGSAVTEESRFLEKHFNLAVGQYDVWDLFSELALRLMSAEGGHGFVVPDSILLPEHEGIRAKLLATHSLSSVVRIGEGCFPGTFRAALVYTQTQQNPPSVVQTLHLRREERNELIRDRGTISSIMASRGVCLPRELFEAAQDHEFRIQVSATDIQLMTRLEADCIDWDDQLDDMRGVELGARGEVVRCATCRRWSPRPRDFNRGRAHCGHCGAVLKSSSKTDVIVNNRKLGGHYKPLITGESVKRYHLVLEKYIDTNYGGINYKDPSFYAPPKLLIRKTGVGIYAAVDHSESLTNQVVFIFRKKPVIPSGQFDYSLEYLLGILSSRLMLAYYILKFGEREWRSFPYVTQKMLKKLPVKDPGAVTAGRDLHSRLTEHVKLLVAARGAPSKALDLAVEDVVSEIYGLTEVELARIDEILESAQRLQIFQEILG